MKLMTKIARRYESPRADQLDIFAEGILCTSGDKDGFNVDPMDIINGGKGTDWDWE